MKNEGKKIKEVVKIKMNKSGKRGKGKCWKQNCGNSVLQRKHVRNMFRKKTVNGNSCRM